MRIVAGRHRGLVLETPADRRIRPTADRVRQALFDVLEHRFGVGAASPLRDARVLDLFCGSGALGIEALSRGAARCVFVDSDATALALAERNVRRARAMDAARFVLRDATRLGPALEAATLAFLDPPYGAGLAAAALVALRDQGWLADGALVCVETGAGERVEPPHGYATLDIRRHGRAEIAILRRLPRDAAPAPDLETRSP
jgi:16S rRNA (guanine966-N2)-methyltransferase